MNDKSAIKIASPFEYGLRWMQTQDANIFELWEKHNRPYPWNKGQFLSVMNKILVLEDNSILGFGVLQLSGVEAYLENMMICPYQQRQGLGTALMEKLMNWAKENGAKKMCLDVQTDNQPAIRLYSNLNFRIVQKRDKAYPRGDDAYVMERVV